jgi:hypothetical protein
MVRQFRYDGREVVSTFGEHNPFNLVSHSQRPNGILQLRMFYFLQEHADFGLLTDDLIFFLEDIEHSLHLVEEGGE